MIVDQKRRAHWCQFCANWERECSDFEMEISCKHFEVQTRILENILDAVENDDSWIDDLEPAPNDTTCPICDETMFLGETCPNCEYKDVQYVTKTDNTKFPNTSKIID